MKDGKSSEEQKNREGCAGIDADVLRESILREGRQAPELHVCGCTGSTNSDALTLGRSNAREAFFVAARQNSGRGRIGRSFFSPEGGLYMSVLTPASGENFLRGDPDWAGFITCSAGIALSGAVRAVFGIRTGLKWVNDLIYKGAKAGGILTEGLFSGGIPVCTVTGAGVNLWPPAPGFPPGLSGNISTLLDAPSPMAREQLAAAFYVRFRDLLDALDEDPAAGKKRIYEEYRELLCVLGCTVEIRRGADRFSGCSEGEYAVAEDLTEDLGLKVRFPDGGTEILSSAEVSVKIDLKAPKSRFSADL